MSRKFIECSHKCSCQLKQESERYELYIAQQHADFVRVRAEMRNLEVQLEYERSKRCKQDGNPDINRDAYRTPVPTPVRAQNRGDDRTDKYIPIWSPEEVAAPESLLSMSGPPGIAVGGGVATGGVATGPPGVDGGATVAASAALPVEIAAPTKPRSDDLISNSRVIAPAHSSARSCIACKTTTTPCWRGSWCSEKLCNPCGLKFKKSQSRCGSCLRVLAKAATLCSCGGSPVRSM